MRNAFKLLCFLLCFIISLPLFSLELKEGLIKLILYEDIGRFSIYYLSDYQNNTYLPLFFDKDPRTSVLTIVSDNRIHRLGESSSFDEVVEETYNGAKIIWTSNNLIITQSFSFISSNNSTLADGIKINITIKNTSTYSKEVGLRFLIDTYLGEDISRHFSTNNSDNLEFENTFLKNSMVNYIISPETEEDITNGLQIITSGSGATTPDSVIIANWSRLNDTSWYYETSTSRNFNLMPYSINDSAVALFYDPLPISPSSSREITILIGNANPNGFNAVSETSSKEIADLLEEATSTNIITNNLLAAHADLIILENLITQINGKLESGSITRGDILIIEQIISELQKKYP
jgi:hypothetical protein